MKKKLAKPVLAEGEVTGHMHLLKANVEVWETEEGVREFELTEPTDLVHEEHNTITLPPQKYHSDRALEYDPIAEEAKRVAD